MALDLAATRQALADKLAEADNVRISPHPILSPPSGHGDGPTLIALDYAAGQTIDYHQAFSGGLAAVDWTIGIMIPVTDERSAWARLDELLSAGTGRSMVDVLLTSDTASGNRTLGGAVSDVIPVSAGAVQTILADDGVRWLIAEIVVRTRQPRREI